MAASGNESISGEFNFQSLNELGAFILRSYSDRAEDEMDVSAVTSIYEFSFTDPQNLLPVMKLYEEEQVRYKSMLRQQNENSNIRLHGELRASKKVLDIISSIIQKTVEQDPCFGSLWVKHHHLEQQVFHILREIERV